MSSESILPPRSVRPHSKTTKLQKVLGSIEKDFKFSTVLLIGAILQSLLVLILPKRYASTPAIIFLGAHMIDIVLITKGMKFNPYLKKVIFKKSTPQILDQNGDFRGPGQEKVAVLLLGVKSNHPMGVFAPDFVKVDEYLTRMNAQLEDQMSQDAGFLGQTRFSRKDMNGATEFLIVSYWRSLEHIHAYAHSPLHREAWLWWDKTLAHHKHIGIMHEVFEAPKGMWEGVYVNFQPTLLGATTYLKRGGKTEAGVVQDEWVSGLLDANRGKLKTSNGRRGMTGEDTEKDKFGKNYYEE